MREWEPTRLTDNKSMAKYRDCIEFIDDNHRVLTSYAQGEDDHWHVFMTAHNRRKM